MKFNSVLVIYHIVLDTKLRLIYNSIIERISKMKQFTDNNGVSCMSIDFLNLVIRLHKYKMIYFPSFIHTLTVLLYVSAPDNRLVNLPEN